MERRGMQLHDAVGINCKKGATTEYQGADVKPASGRGARVSACAGLINQLQRCRLENTERAILGDWWTGLWGQHALNC